MKYHKIIKLKKGNEPNRKIIKTTQYLFSCKFDDPAFDADDSYEHSDAAKNLIDEFGWDVVFPYWFDYLQSNCPRIIKDIINDN